MERRKKSRSVTLPNTAAQPQGMSTAVGPGSAGKPCLSICMSSSSNSGFGSCFRYWSSWGSKASQNTRSPISRSQADPFRDSLRPTVKAKLRIARLLSLLGQPSQAQASPTLEYLNLPTSLPPSSFPSLSSLSSLLSILLSIFWMDPLEDTGHGPPLGHWLQSGLVPALH